MKRDSSNCLVIGRRWWPLGAGIAIVALIVMFALDEPIKVDTAVVERGLVRRTIVDEGRTRMHDTYVVATPFAGTLRRVEVVPGDAVAAGATVARMASSPAGLLDLRTETAAKAAVVAAEAELRAATAQRDFAAVEFARAAELSASNLLAMRTLDGARLQLQAANAAESAARAYLQRARSALLSSRRSDAATVALVAPVPGVVLQIFQESETELSAGIPVVLIGDPRDVDIVAEFLSQDAVNIRTGAPAFVENWSMDGSGGKPIAARVERVEPVARTRISALGIEEQRTRVILRFAEPVPEALRAHNYRLDARIVLDELTQATRVPIGALFRDRETWSVFVIVNRKSRLRHVAVGLRDENFAAITSGLSVGERVVVFPSRDVSDKTRVSF